MEPSQTVPPGDSVAQVAQVAQPEPAASPAGELVVQNGRQSGVRRVLSIPMTLIGRAAGCDVRLNAKGVGLLHCALVQGPSGLIVRNLQNENATLVNGEPVASCHLREGDLLSVGPFHFRVRLPKINGMLDVESLWHEKEALRIQAAAVAAQQAALTEEEGRLQQKRVALQKQEEQLAAHLEEKRNQLVELRDQVREARTALRKERAAHAQRTAEAQRDLDRDHRDNLALRQRNQVRRQRLLKLYRGLKRRRQRQAAESEAALRRREAEIERLRRELETEKEKLHQERAALAQERLRANGEAELGRRQLDDARRQLAVEQRDWEQSRAWQQNELSERLHVLEHRAADLARAEHDLNRRSRRWEEKRAGLEREIEGLENRVRNQRRRLLDVQGTAGLVPVPALPSEHPPAALPVPVPPSVEPADGLRRLALLEGVAAELADQRLHLAEQFERLLRAQERWQGEHEQVAAELEVVGLRLQEYERVLDLREQSLAPTEKVLMLRRDEAVQVRFHLEAWRARLAARETAWEAERDRLLADLGSRENLLEQQQQQLADLRQRWARRRQQELEQLRIEQGRCQEAFQHYTSLWAECFRRSSLLEQEQRALAEKALALEQYRLEVVGHAEDSAAAEKRLERLRRRWAALAAKAERRLTRDRQGLETQLAALEERFRDLEELAADLDQRRVERSNRRTDEEQEQASAAAAAARIQQNLHTLRLQRDLNQWQLDRLRDEVERMALTLIAEADSAPPAMQAA